MKEQNLIWQYVRMWAEEYPQKEALVFNDRRITFENFYANTLKVAKLLLELQVKKGDRVFVLTAARDEFMYIYMASAMVGGILLGLNPRYTRDEIQFLIDDAKPKVGFLVRRYDYLNRDYKDDIMAVKAANPELKHLVVIGDSWEGALSWDTELAKDRSNLDAALSKRMKEVNEDDSVYICYTAGTTGKPKGALLTHKNLIISSAVQNEHFVAHNHKRGEGKWLMLLPVSHIGGVINQAMSAVYWGATIVMMDHFDMAESMKLIQDEKITLTAYFPTLYLLQFMLPNFDSYDLSAVRVFAWAGAAGPEQMVRKLAQIASKTGAVLMTGYGMTELGGFGSITALGDSTEDLINTVGKCYPPSKLRLVGIDGKDVPQGEVAEIWIKSPQTMKGYWNRPEATAETLTKDGWIKTGDLASMDSRGYITMAGRTKEMFKSGGENIYPREIEAIIERDPNVALVAVLPVPDKIWGHVGKALIIPAPGKTVDLDSVKELCKKHLANYKVPKQFEVRSYLPLTPTLKVDRIALAKELAKELEA